MRPQSVIIKYEKSPLLTLSFSAIIRVTINKTEMADTNIQSIHSPLKLSFVRSKINPNGNT